MSRAHPGVLWTHNDSGDGPYLYATDLTGRDLGAVLVPGAEAIDWEDIAIAPCPTGGGDGKRDCVYIADTGDNLERRSSVSVYIVAEPDPPTGPGDTLRTTRAPVAIRFRYPDGRHDVEAIFIGTKDGAVYLVSKGRSGPIRLYRLPRRSLSGTNPPSVAELVQDLPIEPEPALGRWVTAAAERSDGRLVAIRTYTEIYFFVPDSSGRLTPASGDPCPLYGLEPQGEAVDFLDDSTLVLTSESAGAGPAPIHSVLINRCRTGS